MESSKDILMKKLSTEFSKQNIGGGESVSGINTIKKNLNTSYKPTGRKKVKQETEEATGSGSSGGYVAPLFSEPKRMDSMFKDEQPKSKVKGGFVHEEEMEEKWSEKYKKSIDCNNPKGFSQRAHCQGKKKKLKENLTESERSHMAKLRDIAKKNVCKGDKNCTAKDKIEDSYQELKRQYRMGLKVEKEHKSEDPKQIVIDHLSEDPKYYTKLKKVEATEATGSGSSGSYESPSFLAKSMSPKKWRGASKTQIPGGKFVTVKKKCKKFPYCNQGDINALSFSESKISKNILSNLSERYGISESMIKDILLSEFKKNKK
jgi:hypothetical protein